MIESTKLYKLLSRTEGFISLTYDGCEYVLMKRYRGEIQRYIFTDKTLFKLTITWHLRNTSVQTKHIKNNYMYEIKPLLLNELEEELNKRVLIFTDSVSLSFNGKSIILYSKP